MITKPWLYLNAARAHDWAPLFLTLYKLFPNRKTPEWKSFNWKNLQFKNRLGIAGGVDKDAEFLDAWWKMGSGFIELGTVTPQPQEPNPGQIIDRDNASQALWNKMGFPSGGAIEFRANLLQIENSPRQTPVFINIGKNRTTSLEEAHFDYEVLIDELSDLADAFVINISSPNTAGLRALQQADNLKKFLAPIIELNKKKLNLPLLLKISPDNSREELAAVINTAAEAGISGFILTNTTIKRKPSMKFSAEGGVSGAPLKELSIQNLKWTLEILGKHRNNFLIVSAGGVLTPEDVAERLHLGADLVQIYSALIFEGPGFFQKVAKHVLG
jgi:dihydroorotate dehydrogenase